MSEINKKLESIISFLKGYKKSKFLSSYILNTFPLFKNYFKKKSEIPLETSQELLNSLIIMDKQLLGLKSNGFFEIYGHYLENETLVLKVFEVLNKMIRLLKKYIEEDLHEILIDTEILEKFDSLITEINIKINKQGSKIKKNADNITHEFTYVLWLKNYSNKEYMDDSNFLDEIKLFLEIFNENIKDYDISVIFKDIHEMDDKNTKIILPRHLDSFFKFSWTFPSEIYKLKYNNVKELGLLSKKEYKHEEEEKFASIIIGDNLVLKVIEADPNYPGYLGLNTNIYLSPTGFKINNENEIEYKNKRTAKFGRYSEKGSLIPDIVFDKKLTEISRNEFKILINDNEIKKYTIICESKNTDTTFKVCDKKLKLFPEQIIYFSKYEILHIKQMFIPKEGEIPLLTLKGVGENPNSETYNHIYTFKGKNTWKIGSQEPFISDSIRTNSCMIGFEDNLGWFIQGPNINNESFKLKPTRVSLGNYDSINEGVPTPERNLEIGMIISIENFSFLITELN